MNFNLEKYKEYYKAAGYAAKNGVWDVIRFPNGKYCFATEQWLGDHGKINNHPLLNKKFHHTKTGKVYVMDSVCIHWDLGYYYHATLRDFNNSHTTAMIGNINCTKDYVLECIGSFNENYELL